MSQIYMQSVRTKVCDSLGISLLASQNVGERKGELINMGLRAG